LRTTDNSKNHAGGSNCRFPRQQAQEFANRTSTSAFGYLSCNALDVRRGN
jgi:hypothetical protein